MAFAGCTNTIEVAEQGNFEIHQIAGTTNATLTASGSKVVITTFGVKCTYTAGTGIDLGTLTGSTSGKAAIDLNTVVSKSAGALPVPGNGEMDCHKP